MYSAFRNCEGSFFALWGTSFFVIARSEATKQSHSIMLEGIKTGCQCWKWLLRVIEYEIAAPALGRFAMTGEDVGINVWDCHDMFSTCLAMTGIEGFIIIKQPCFYIINISVLFAKLQSSRIVLSALIEVYIKIFHTKFFDMDLF